MTSSVQLMQYAVRVHHAPAVNLQRGLGRGESTEESLVVLDLFGPTVLKSFADDVIVYVPGIKQ